MSRLLVIATLAMAGCVYQKPHAAREMAVSIQGSSSQGFPDRSAGTGTSALDAGNTAEAFADGRLLGAWVSETVSTSLGPVKSILVFTPYEVHLVTKSVLPLGTVLYEGHGGLQARGGVLKSDKIYGGTTVAYAFEDEMLVVTLADGRVVRFHRVASS